MNFSNFATADGAFQDQCSVPMAPTRKSRVNKRYAGVSSYSPGKDVGNSSKTRQRGSVSFSPDKDVGNSNKTSQRVILHFYSVTLDRCLWIC